jgi:putative exosortase-associated protein (TIGR04073 family)
MVGIVSGIPKGMVKALVRSLAGVYEIVTFPLPVPSDYKPILEPEFVEIRQFAVVPSEY